MCWACYTSLSGGLGAPVPAGGAIPGAIPGAVPGTVEDSGEKKKIEPKQLAIIGVGLLVAVGFGVKTMLGGGGEGGDDIAMPTISDTMPPSTTPSNPTSSGSGTAAQPAAGPNTLEAPKEAAASAQPFPYKMFAAPNPQEQQWATLAIVPNQGELKETGAKQLADFAYRYQQKVKKYPAMEIFVINTPQAANTFAEYQNKRAGKRMSESDYMALQQVWSSTPVRYLNVNGRTSVSYPQRDPSGFWKNSSSG